MTPHYLTGPSAGYASGPAESARSASFGARFLAVARGVWAVVRLLWGALWALTAAALGVPPVRPARLGHVIADEYRAGRVGAVDAEVIEDDPDPNDDENDSHDGQEGRR